MRTAFVGAFALALLPGVTAAQNSSVEDRLVHGRAVEAVVWGMPAVNTDLMLQEMQTKTGGKVNQVIYWGRPLDWHNQTLTPNPDAIYFMAFFNTKDVGPIVIEIPPGDANGSLNGNIVTMWQTSLEDVGLLGLDKGAGGRFVILPQKASDGSIVVQFGGCDGTIRNCLPIMRGWNYTVRLYRPRPETLNGTWKFPEAKPVS
ncbi:hypothetical protein ACVJGD_000709 [Bradyrhizobium sp. USDA 10063]